MLLTAALPVFDFATNSIARRIAGIDPTVSLSRFDDYPSCFGRPRTSAPTSHSALRTSHSFWLKDVDFSCASPWNDGCGTLRAGTLISKRHVIFAKHFPLGKGERILFVDQSGETCPVNIEATKDVWGTDIMIGLLNYEVTPNIHPAKILPENFAEYIGDGAGLPIVTFNQREQAFLSEMRPVTPYAVPNGVSSNAAWRALGGKIVVGDSGNPAFLLIGDEPILLYCLLHGGVGKGPSIFRYRKEIQKVMDELCPGYKLEVFDFSRVKIEK